MSFPMRAEDVKVIYLKDSPADVSRQVLTACHDRFIVCTATQKCEKCGKMVRYGSINCWVCSCGKISDSFTVRLPPVVEKHGFFGTLLSHWNPAQLTCRIQEYGNGSRLEIKLSGTLSWAEKMLSVLFCALMCGLGIYVSLSAHEYFHLVLALGIFPLGPALYVLLRRQQERDLLQFVSKRLPELLPGSFTEQTKKSD